MAFIIKKIKKSLQIHGLSYTVIKALRACSKPVFSIGKSALLIRPLNKPFFSYRSLRNLEMSEGTMEDLLRVDYVDDFRISAFKHYLARGARCFIGSVGKTIVMFHFGIDRSYTDLVSGITIVPLAGQIYCFDGEVKPEERGKTYAIQHLHQYYNKMEKEGFREIITLIDLKNRPSWRIHERMGFKPMRLCYVYRIFGIRIIRWRAWPLGGSAS